MKRKLLLIFAIILFVGGWNQAAGQDNLARNPVGGGNVTATDDAHQGNLVAGNAIDGDNATRWGNYGVANVQTGWLQIQWENAQTFNKVKLLCENGMTSLHSYKIQTSSDGSDWTDAAVVTGARVAKDGDYETILLGKNYTANYIRFQGVSTELCYGIYEFEVYKDNIFMDNNVPLTITPSVVNKNTASTITVSAKDQNGNDYYDFTLGGATTGTAINKVAGTLNQYTIAFNPDNIGDTETITATDVNDNTKTATATISVQTPVFDHIAVTAGNSDFVTSGQTTTVTCFDQFGATLSVSVANVAVTNGSVSGDGGEFIITPTNDTENVAISITYNGVTKSITLYAADAVSAPRTPHDVYKPVFVVYDAQDGNQVFSYPTTPASFGDYKTVNGLIFRRVQDANSFVIGKNDTSIFPSANADGQINWLPSDNTGKELKADIFVCNAGEQARIYLENSSTQDWQTLTEGWNTLTFDVTSAASITAIRIETKDRGNNNYPDILVANVYFTKNSNDETAPVFDTGYPTATVGKRDITFNLKATDNESATENLHYVITNGTITKYVKGSELVGDDKTYVLTGLTPETNYGTFTITVYDEMGNSADYTTETLITDALSLVSFTVTPPVVSIPKNGESSEFTFVALDDESNNITDDVTITMAYKSGDQNIVTYDATNKKLIAENDAIGHGVWTATATYKGTSISADVEIFVYETALNIEYKLNATDEWSTAYTGEIGQLKELLNGITAISGNDEDRYKQVYGLKVNGNINDVDIKTLRHMAGGTDLATSDATLGNLHELDIKSVRLAATPSYAANLPDDASDAEKTALSQARLDNCYVQAVDSTFTTNLQPIAEQPAPQPFFITTGGYYNNYNGLNITEVNTDQGESLEVGLIPSADVNLLGFEILPGHIFDHCINLVSIVLPDDIKQFGAYCFNECKNLTTVTNYKNVVDFGTNAFAGTGLVTFDLSTSGEISSDLKIVGNSMFKNCTELTTVTMTNNIKEIGGGAFAFCPKFTLGAEGTLPSNLEWIGQYAFFTKGAKSLSKVVFPSTLKVIDGFAFDTFEGSGGSQTSVVVDFSNCSNLEYISVRAFSDNKNMTILPASGQLPNSIKSIDTYAFAGTGITQVILPKNDYYKTVKYGSFGWNRNLTSVTIPENVKYIMDVAFVANSQMHATLNNKLTLETIGVSSFESCSTLTNDFEGVTAVTSIGDKGFAGCTNLTTQSGIDLMKNLTRLNYYTFASCSSLESVNLPASLTSMGDGVFADCNSLKKVNVANPVAPTMDHEELQSEPYKHGDDEEASSDIYDVFADSQPNQIEIVFTDVMKTNNTESGYKTYRANKHFMNVMKRTMSEEAATYDIPAQFGADVTITRTIGKDKWNTLVLPFGLSDNADRTGHTANVLTDALGTNGQVAAYRGLRGGNTFMFLLYQGTDAIKPFQPVIVKTSEAKNKLEFKDVDVNYAGLEEDTKVAASDLDGAAASGATIDGGNLWAYGGEQGQAIDNVESSKELDAFKGTTKTDFRFIGTFKYIYSSKYPDKRTNTTTSETYDVPAASKIIKDNDYYISNNRFYEVTDESAENRYTLKGFRGWFQHSSNIPNADPEPSSAKSSVINIEAVGWDEAGNVVNEIVSIDAATGEEIVPQDIYSMDGRLVKARATSTDGLPKGIYIIGGKKTVVK